MSRLAKIALWLLASMVCVYLVAPVIVVIPLSLSSGSFLEFPPPGYSFIWYQEFFTNRDWVGSLVRTIYVAMGAVSVSVVVGTAAVYGLSRGRSRILQLLEPLFVLPIIVPVVVYATGAYLISIRLGLIGSMWILILTHSVLALPFVVLNVAVGLKSIGHDLELAAQTLGASRAQAFLRITLPLMFPAVMAAAVFAALLSLDEAVIALFLVSDAGRTLPVQMYSSIRLELSPVVPVGATMMLAFTIAIGGAAYGLQKLAVRRWRRDVAQSPSASVQ